jgi:hypothetical protein
MIWLRSFNGIVEVLNLIWLIWLLVQALLPVVFFYLQETHLKKLYNNSENWLCVQHLCRWGWTSCSGFFHNLQRLFAFIVLRTIDYNVKLIQFLDFEERRRGFGIFIFFTLCVVHHNGPPYLDFSFRHITCDKQSWYPRGLIYQWKKDTALLQNQLKINIKIKFIVYSILSNNAFFTKPSNQ